MRQHIGELVDAEGQLSARLVGEEVAWRAVGDPHHKGKSVSGSRGLGGAFMHDMLLPRISES